MPKRDRTGKQGGRRYVTQKDVAERAGVSPSIVSYVINNGPRSISEETRQRVLRAINELEYRPNVHAQKLMRASWDSELAPGQFGIIIGGSRDALRRPYYPNIIYGVLDEAARCDLTMRFFLFIDELDDPITYNKLVHPEEVSAIILINVSNILESSENFARLEQIRTRVPNLVSIGLPLPNIPSVMVDMTNAIRQSTNYLFDLGHRRIAYLGNSERRQRGFILAHAERNLPYDPSLMLVTQSTPQSGYDAAQALLDNDRLRGDQRVTAIVAGSDEIAWGIMRRLHDAGLRIPTDVSVVGLDNHILDAYTIPALTSVQLPQEQIGVLAIQTLLQRKGHTSEPAPVTILPTELIIRESCSSPA